MINKEEIEKASFFKVRENRYLDIYIKKPYNKYAIHFKNKYFNSFENYLGESIDVSGKYIILTFVLRNEKDILPYIKSTKPLEYRIKELEETNKEHQKLNGKLQKKVTYYEDICKGKSIQELGMSDLYKED